MDEQVRLILDAHSQEIDKLRERQHDQSSILAAHTQLLTHLGDVMAQGDGHIHDKLDAIHLSIKADIEEIKPELSSHERQIAKLQGGLIVISAGLPFLTGFLLYFIDRSVG